MTARTRVLWLVKGLGRGGAEQLLLNAALHLDRDSLDVHAAYVLPHKDALVPALRESGVRVHCLTGSGAPWPVALRRLVTSYPFDAVHTHSPAAAAVARLVSPSSTVMFHTEHNMWPRYRWPSRLANAVTLRRNRRVWAVSDGVARSMRPALFTRGVSIDVLVHGLGAVPPPASPGARTDALDLLGLEPGPFTVGSVGNLTQKKNQVLLIAALVLLRQHVPEARLVLVGGGPGEAELRRKIVSNGLSGAVVLTGVRDDVPALLPAFDAFALSSRYEGLPIALLEAMAAGVAPVVTAVGGIPEVITDGRHGLLVPPEDPTALAAALDVLASDPSLRARIADAARCRAADFGIGPAVRTMTSAYQDARRDQELVVR